MADLPVAVEIPNRALFKAAEVCELAKVQPYVLRSWEAEFRSLGVMRSGSTVRVYRREDIELVLRIRHLVLVEGLTLAGVRRKFEDEQEPPLDVELPPVVHAPSPRATDAVRERVGRVKRELRSLLDMLDAPEASAKVRVGTAVSVASDFALAAPGGPDASGSSSTKRTASGAPQKRRASPRRKRSA